MAKKAVLLYNPDVPWPRHVRNPTKGNNPEEDWQTVERQTNEYILEGHHLAEDSARFGDSMLRFLPNHRTPWLHNDDADADDDYKMCTYVLRRFRNVKVWNLQAPVF